MRDACSCPGLDGVFDTDECPLVIHCDECYVLTVAILWELFGWLWLLGGRDELETWADVGDCCNDCDGS